MVCGCSNIGVWWDYNLTCVIRYKTSTRHRVIKMTPIQAIDPKELGVLLKNHYSKRNGVLQGDTSKSKFKEGDLVRLVEKKHIFGKEANDVNYTIEVFEVSKVFHDHGVMYYHLQDLMKEPVEGIYYDNELIKATKEMLEISKVEKVIKRQGIWSYVKYLGWPDKFNQWVKTSELIR